MIVMDNHKSPVSNEVKEYIYEMEMDDELRNQIMNTECVNFAFNMSALLYAGSAYIAGLHSTTRRTNRVNWILHYLAMS